MGVESWMVRAVTPPGVSLGEMKQFVRNHFQTFVNDKDLTQAERSFSQDFLDDEPAGVQVGIKAAKSMMQRAHARWPDLHVKAREIVAEDDRVMVRNVWTPARAISKTGAFGHE